MKRKNNSTRILLGSLAIMSIFVSVLLVADQRRMQAHRHAAGSFQRLVGGLGFGSATDWSRCAHSFDPRVSCECFYDAGPLPGGANFCPYQTSSVLFTARQASLLTATESEEHAADL
ncbi:MAG: hypothetical protein O3C40_17675 [Planctomycetota bacterium]|nr:hypothetical protein [Planctomycetota bacterium]